MFSRTGDNQPVILGIGEMFGQRRVKSVRGRTRTPHSGDLYEISRSRAGCRHLVLADVELHSCGKLIGAGKPFKFVIMLDFHGCDIGSGANAR